MSRQWHEKNECSVTHTKARARVAEGGGIKGGQRKKHTQKHSNTRRICRKEGYREGGTVHIKSAVIPNKTKYICTGKKKNGRKEGRKGGELENRQWQ